MTEVLNDQNEQRDPRPLGRFFLSKIHEYYENKPTPAYEYARSFAGKYEDLLHRGMASFIATAEINDDGDVEMSPNLPDFDKGVRLEFDPARIEEKSYTWRLNGARDQYDLIVSAGSSSITHYEYTDQFNVLRRRQITDSQTIGTLQQLVEEITSHPFLLSKINNHYGELYKDMEKLESLRELASIRPLTHREQKDLVTLKHRIAEPYFHSGSISRADKIPLVSQHDRHPSYT